MTVSQLCQLLEQLPQDLQVGTLSDVPDSGGGSEYREVLDVKHVFVDKHGRPDFTFARVVLWGDPDASVR